MTACNSGHNILIHFSMAIDHIQSLRVDQMLSEGWILLCKSSSIISTVQSCGRGPAGNALQANAEKHRRGGDKTTQPAKRSESSSDESVLQGTAAQRQSAEAAAC